MADSATEFIDTTTADVFIPEIWSNDAIVAREQRLVFANLVNRKYEAELKYGDVIHVPSITNLAARTKTINSNITYETNTETNTNITINTHQYAAMAIEDIVKVQANRDLRAAYAGKMGYALDIAVDDVLAGRVDDFSQALGTLAVELRYEDLLRARQYLDDANAPNDNRAVVVSPAQETGMMKLDHFVNRDYMDSQGVGQGNKDAARAWFGNWLGMPVYKSTNVEGSNAAGHDNGMFHKEALALVMQIKPKTVSQYDIDYLTDKIAMQQLYGSQEMRDDHGVFMRGA